MTTHRLQITIVWLSLFLSLTALGDGDFSISAHLIGGGSGTANGGEFRLISSVGQPGFVGRQGSDGTSVSVGFSPMTQVTGSGSGGGGDDIDGDGLPNWWENTYYGSDTAADPNAMASNGINKVYGAYVAGFSPIDPNAGFWVTDHTHGLNHFIEWNGVSGRVYAVYWTSNLLNGFDQPLGANLPWTPDIFTDTNHPASQKGFYKIDVELE